MLENKKKTTIIEPEQIPAENQLTPEQADELAASIMRSVDSGNAAEEMLSTASVKSAEDETTFFQRFKEVVTTRGFWIQCAALLLAAETILKTLGVQSPLLDMLFNALRTLKTLFD